MDKIEILLGKIEDTKRQIDLKVKFATRALDNDELEKAEKLEQEIADLRSELKDKEEELAKLKEEENADSETVTVQNDGRSTRSQFNAFDLGVMPETKVTSQEVRDFKAYLESRDDIKGGSLKTDSGFVVIPEEIVTDIFKLKEVEFNLDKYVTVKK
ncbi:phage major capsid protein, partial [Staphylococcus pseudintermedius]